MIFGSLKCATVLVTGALALIVAGPVAAGTRSITVMTRNLDAGTDMNLVMGATDAASFAQAVAATLAEIRNSAMEERAARIAQEIANNKPDLIGLQEVTLWRTGPLSIEPTGASEVLYDQLQLLMKELERRSMKYTVVVIDNLVDVEVPVPSENLNLRITDRDVVLARNSVSRLDMDVFNIQTHRFKNLLTLPVLGGLTVQRSYEAVDVALGGKIIHFITTHVENAIPGIPETALLQNGQAGEILAFLDPTVPTVLLGDFNANAEAGPDHTGTVELVLKAGFQDVWATLNPGDPGYTWPLFPEDNSTMPLLCERIDLIFSRGLTPVSVQRLGLGGFISPAGSDHAGLVATLQLPE